MEVLFKYLTLARMNMRRRGLLFFSSFFEKVSNNIRERQKRDVEFLNSLSMSKMNDILWPLYVSFVCLSFLDVYSTILALSSSTSFHELNPIAGPLFGMQLPGLLLALTQRAGSPLDLARGCKRINFYRYVECSIIRYKQKRTLEYEKKARRQEQGVKVRLQKYMK
ncbi:MAG: hypothetical protein QXQ39_05295 [Conexivisphaerales archaeon]